MITLKKEIPIVISARVREEAETIDITGWVAEVGFKSAFSGKVNVTAEFSVSDQQTHRGEFMIKVEDTSMFNTGEYTCDILLTPPVGSEYHQGYTQTVTINMKEGVAG